MPGKALGLASGTPGTDEDPLLPSMKEGRGDTPSTTTGLAKTVSHRVAAQAQPATSTPLPPELIEDAAGDGNKLKPRASKANETLAASNSTSAAATPSAADAIDGAEPPKPVAAEAPPVKPAVPQLDDRAADARRDEDIDSPTSIATGSIDRPHSLGATNAAHTAVEKLAEPDPASGAAGGAYRARRGERSRPDQHRPRAGRPRSHRHLARLRARRQDLGRSSPSTARRPSSSCSATSAGSSARCRMPDFKTDSGSLSFNLRGDQRQQQNPSMPWASTRPAAEPWLAANRPLPQQAALARLVADGRLDIEV